jgi:hypothetical protein
MATLPRSAARVSGREAKLFAPPPRGFVSMTAIPRRFTITTRPPVSCRYRYASAATGASRRRTGCLSESSASEANVVASCSTLVSRSRLSVRAFCTPSGTSSVAASAPAPSSHRRSSRLMPAAPHRSAPASPTIQPSSTLPRPARWPRSRSRSERPRDGSTLRPDRRSRPRGQPLRRDPAGRGLRRADRHRRGRTDAALRAAGALEGVPRMGAANGEPPPAARLLLGRA